MSAQPRIEQLTELIEGFKLCPALKEETITRIGRLVITGGYDTEPNEQQYAVIERASLGDNTKQAATNLGWEEAKVVEVREQLLALHRVPEMSGVVNNAIANRILPIAFEPSRGITLSRDIDLTLEAFCVGIPNYMISQALGQSKAESGSNLHLLVRKRLDGNGRTNAVLQAYRRGFRTIPKQT